MEKIIDYSLTIPDGTPQMIAAGGLIFLSAVIVSFMIILKRWDSKVAPAVVGLVGYFIAFACQWGIITGISLIPSVSIAFEYNPDSLNIITAIVSAVIFTFILVLVSYMLLGRYENKGGVYMAGLGFGIGNGILYGISTITNYVWCTGIEVEGLENVFKDMAESEAIQVFDSISSLFTAKPVYWVFQGISCVFDLLIVVAVISVIYGAVKGFIPKYWYIISAVILFVMTIVFQLIDVTSIMSIAIYFGIKLVIFAATAYYIFFVVGKKIQYEGKEK